jgi:ketosteroid isomerase-like protein
MKVFVLTIVLSVLLISFTNPKRIVGETDEILAVIRAQEAAWNSGSIKNYMEGYEQSDETRFISGGTLTTGWQTVMDRYKAGYPDRKSMGMLTFSNLKVEGLGPGRALVYGMWELKKGNENPWGMFTLIFKKTKAGWRIIHDHTSLAK